MTQSIEPYAKLIRAKGYRLTPQRQLIYETLAEAGCHLTATEIAARVQAQLPVINTATVYRTLEFLYELKLVTMSEIGKETVYEVMEDVPHHHLVCRSCGHTEELAHTHFQRLADHLRREHAFEPEINHLSINGICEDCQEPAAETT